MGNDQPSYEEQRAAAAIGEKIASAPIETPSLPAAGPLPTTPTATTNSSSLLFGGWGGMLSALAEVKARATTHLDKLADAFDPNVVPDNATGDAGPPEVGGAAAVAAGEEGEKLSGEERSFRGLFDKLSPVQFWMISLCLPLTLFAMLEREWRNGRGSGEDGVLVA